jgi:hypothetical protein
MEFLIQLATIAAISIGVGVVGRFCFSLWRVLFPAKMWCPVCDEDHKNFHPAKSKDEQGLYVHCRQCGIRQRPWIVNQARRIRLNIKTTEGRSRVFEDNSHPEIANNRTLGRIWYGQQMSDLYLSAGDEEATRGWADWSISLIPEQPGVRNEPQFNSENEAAAWQQIGISGSEVVIDESIKTLSS